MKSVKLAALIAVIAEAILDLAYWLFGGFSIASEHNTNFLGLVTVMFHLPGERLIDSLSHSMHLLLPGWVWVAFIIFTGVLQFFLLALLVIFVRIGWQNVKSTR